MALLDVLKKKELTEINRLKEELKNQNSLLEESNNKYSSLSEKYSGIIDIENEKAKLSRKFDDLNIRYQKAFDLYQGLIKETLQLISKKKFADYGIYESIFDFDHSSKYREKISENLSEQKELIKSNKAVICNTQWTVDGSIVKGRVMTKKNIKILLMAFNGECDAQIEKARWNNCQLIAERLDSIYNRLNKLSEPDAIQITREFFRLKKEQLQLAFEYQQKLYQEKEEARSIAEEKREEEKAQREIEKARKDAERDELYYSKALEKVKKEIESATGAKYESLADKITYLESELNAAIELKSRAISMAQQTRRGYVYVISNIGSFGEDVFKIGMTRRLDPVDRIRELSNASVPFKYDIHAMILSEDAPTLESELHKTFSSKRLNLINGRKEFFNVNIDEIESKISEMGLNVEVAEMSEARDYRESISLRSQMTQADNVNSIDYEDIKSGFPEKLLLYDNFLEEDNSDE